MSEAVAKEDWDALIEVLDRAISLLDGRKVQPVKESLLEFTTTAAMLGLQDVADAVTSMLEFLVNKVGTAWDAEAAATLSFTIAGFREKMAAETYSPTFSESMKEILLFLDFFETEEEEPQPSTPPKSVTVEPPAPAPPESTPLRPAPEAPVALVGREPDAPEVIPQVIIAEPLPPPPSPAQEIDIPFDILSSEPPGDATETFVDRLFQEEPPVPEIPEQPFLSPALSEEPLLPPPMPGDATALYTEMLELDPTSSVFVRLAEQLSAQGLWSDTVEVCRRGLLHHPSNLRAHVLLGLSLREMGETLEASLVLSEARTEVEKNVLLYRVLAEIAGEEGDAPQAEHLMHIYDTFRERERHLPGHPEPRPAGPSPRMQSSAVPKPASTVEERLIHALTRLQAQIDAKGPPSAAAPRLFSDESRDKLKQLLSSSRAS